MPQGGQGELPQSGKRGRPGPFTPPEEVQQGSRGAGGSVGQAVSHRGKALAVFEEKLEAYLADKK